MKGYSTEFEKGEFACARMEDTNVSFKDLAEVCGRIRGKNADWAVGFLEKASKGDIPVLYKRHNKKLGHRRELGGKKGRYPKKAAKAVLKVLNSAIANGRSRGLGDAYEISHATANRKMSYGRVAPKGRWARSDYETSRIELVLRPLEEIPKGVEVRPPAKGEKKPEKPKEEPRKEIKKEEKPKAEPKKAEEKKPEPKKEEKPQAEPKKEEKKSEAHVHEAHHGEPVHEAAEHGHAHAEHEAKKPEKKSDVK